MQPIVTGRIQQSQLKLLLLVPEYDLQAEHCCCQSYVVDDLYAVLFGGNKCASESAGAVRTDISFTLQKLSWLKDGCSMEL